MDTVIGLRFDGAEDVAIHWAARSGLEHALNLETLEELYERALPYFKAYGYMLTTKHGWVDEGITEIDDMQLALCLGRDEQLYVDDSSAPHVSRLVLPRRFSSFTDPELAQDWAAMFSNLVMTTTSNYPDTITEPSDKPEIFQLGRAGIPRPLQNIIYLLQCLSPGLIVVRTTEDDFEEDGFPGPQSVTETGLPPALWVGEHIEDLEFVFGTNLALDLYKTADDPYSSVEEVDSRDGSSDTLSDTSFSSSASGYEEEWSSWDRSEEDMDKAEYEFFAEESDYISHQKEIPQTNYQNKNHFAAEAVEIFDDSANYRHCDSSCSFCGKCSNRFAERLTELLLRTAIVG